MKKSICMYMVLFALVVCNQKLNAQGVGIGILNPDPTAKLHLHSNTQGTLITRMTSVERDAIANPADGLMIYNLDSKCINLFRNLNWFEVCGNCINPPKPLISGNSPLCINDTVFLSASSISGAVYQWSGPNGFSSNLQNPQINGISTAATGTYTVSVSRAGCISDTAALFITVNNCGTSSINYSNGNEAYWSEAVLGFRPVTIAGGTAVYTYNASVKQYVNGNNILLPNLVNTADGEFVNANSFYGFSGGTPNNNDYHWDAQSNSSVSQPSDFDRIQMFISPISAYEMNYCKAMNINTSSCSSCIIDGPNATLAYSAYSPLSGTYNLGNSSEQVNAGSIKGGGDNYFSQQQLDLTTNTSYCVATYGKGWRIPTDIEMGHTSNTYGWNMGIDPSYNASQGSSNYRLWSSARELPNGTGGRFILWPQGTSQNAYWDGNGVTATNQNVRCVYQGR